jgi:hypothetical protein
MSVSGGRPGVWVAVGGGVVVLAVTAGLIAGKILFGGVEVRGDGAPVQTTSPVVPSAVPLPDVTAETAAATLTFLDGDGQVLVQVTDTADRLHSTVGGADPNGCRGMAGDLNKDYPVDTMLDRLHAVPDPFLGEWLSTYWGSALGALDACVDSTTADAYLADADDALALIDKRIAQLKEVK